jgi:O-antigen/teichoic acid export membrane protein
MLSFLSFNQLKKKINSDSHRAVLARGAVGAFIVKIFGVGLLFGLHIILARLLGVQHYGIYVYVSTWINILTILCLLGFQTSLVRFIAEYNVKQQWALLRGILRKSEQFVLGFSVSVSLTGVIIIRIMGDLISPDMAITFYIAFALLPVFAFCRLREASLRALKRIIQSELPLQVIRPVLTGLALIGLFCLIGNSLKAWYAMTVNVISVFCVAVIGTIFLHKLLPNEVLRTQPFFSNKQWLKVSLPLLLVAGMSVILKRTDIVMIGFFLGADDAGIYGVASQISNLVVFALMAINTILGPMISELYHTRQKQQLQKIITLAARSIFVFTLVMSLILIIFGKFVLGLFGLVFISAYIPLLVLLAGQIINSLAGSVGLIMSMSGNQNLMGVAVSISVAINIILNLALIPVFGLLGAAVATVISTSMWKISMLIFLKRRIGINSTVITIPKYG